MKLADKRRRMTKKVTMNFHPNLKVLDSYYDELNKDRIQAKKLREFEAEQARLAKIKEQEDVAKFKLQMRRASKRMMPLGKLRKLGSIYKKEYFAAVREEHDEVAEQLNQG